MADEVAEAGFEQLTVSFETPEPEVNAAALAATVQAVVTLIEAANAEVTSTTKLTVKAKALEEGSFRAILELLPPVGMFVAAHLPTVRETLNILKQYFEIRLLAKGQRISPPDDKGRVTVQNVTVNNSGVINVLVNPQVSSAVNNAAVAMMADETIKAARLLQGEQEIPIVEIEREQLGYLQYDGTPIVETPQRRERTVKKAALIVRSPDLLGEAMWSFKYKGGNISATIKDGAFLSEVQRGNRSFTGGTEMIADMIVQEDHDTDSNSYVPKGYVISKVHELRMQKHLSETKGKKKKPGKGKK